MNRMLSLISPYRRSVIAKDMEVQGDLVSREKGVLEIHGSVHGRVRHGGLVIVAATGYCSSGIQASAVEILGEVHGDVEVTGKLLIRSSGQLFGDARCSLLSVKNGGVFEGTNRTRSLSSPVPAPAAVLATASDRSAALKILMTPVMQAMVPPAQADDENVSQLDRDESPRRVPTPFNVRPAVEGDPDSPKGPLFHGHIVFKG